MSINQSRYCSHPNLQSTARTDYCSDCGYEFYYGDAHSTGDSQLSREVNRGRDAGENCTDREWELVIGDDDSDWCRPESMPIED